jgi:hypothetical protein
VIVLVLPRCSTIQVPARATLAIVSGRVWCKKSGSLREGGRLGAVLHAQLAQDVGDVDAGGLLADEQLGTDLGVGQAVGDQP